MKGKKKKLKLYFDTDIHINEEEKLVVISRGTWNFTSIKITLESTDNEVLKIFKSIKSIGEIDMLSISEKYNSNFMKLVEANLFYIEKRKEDVNLKKTLFITDVIKELNSAISNYSFYKNSFILDKEDFKNNVIVDCDYENHLLNPLSRNKIQNSVDSYIEINKIEIVIVVLAKTDDHICRIINKYFPNLEVAYLLLDNAFTYIFGVKKLYTGCYSCFSQRNKAKMKNTSPNILITKSSSKSPILDEKMLNLLNFSVAYLAHNLNEFHSTGVLPLFGKLVCIFNQTLEIKYENLLRFSMCEECGYIGRARNKERNIFLKEVLKRGNF